ncbi:lipase/esterase [Eremomyces bilateralis CBS 781.70]|uniref:Lipase/esterase n=1 Tax=Eremomyces bilateralis CBS 781.70 TaxID=1392243 RepID=A0A6G1GFK1_9PEZI|nr:lipase/esterase [Eremomyces bilateralis CBS 781.70]KAF1816885.1 lipase/esterase [Eremomyces bilateralis CBS 781.70]
MDSPFAVLKFLILKTPFILRTVLYHALSLSPTSSKWDLRTTLIVNIVRDMLTNSPPSTISKQQKDTLRDPGIKGKMWVSKVTMPAPSEDAVRDLLFETIDALKQENEEYSRPALVPVEAEWTGYRAGVADNAPELSISEAEKYENLMKEVTSDVTLLYFHGGAYYLMDPCTQRSATSKYSNLTGGRVLSVRYRLAPQNPFPAALLDALVSYLSLLYPPAGALHKPVPASHIVITGDSAGGNLSLVLLQALLQIHRAAPAGNVPTVVFHGKVVELPLPAGVALSPPSLDLTRCMPSTENNAQYNYLPPPSISPTKSPPCTIWPTDPPRADLFCEGSALCHPLVSPLAAKSWEGSPPIFVVCGEEMLTDECKAFVQKAAKQRVRAVWEQYEAMPHCFSLLLEGNAGGAMSFDSWSDFVKRAVQSPEEIVTRGEFITAKNLVRRPVEVYKLMDMSDEDILVRMRNARQKMIECAATAC